MNTLAYQTVTAIYPYWKRALWNHVVYGIVCSVLLSILTGCAGGPEYAQAYWHSRNLLPEGDLKGCLEFTYVCSGPAGEEIGLPFPLRITITSTNPDESTSARQHRPLTPRGGPWLDDWDHPISVPVEERPGTYCIHVELVMPGYGERAVARAVAREVAATVEPGKTTFVRIRAYDIVKIWQVVDTRYTYKFNVAATAPQ
ncbi:MAG: hypothetical protein ABSF52_06730 [Syntrophobacteraceae bacterium]|jgi:hypothetical protein